jgi:hypothetical protein
MVNTTENSIQYYGSHPLHLMRCRGWLPWKEVKSRDADKEIRLVPRAGCNTVLYLCCRIL